MDVISYLELDNASSCDHELHYRPNFLGGNLNSDWEDRASTFSVLMYVDQEK